MPSPARPTRGGTARAWLVPLAVGLILVCLAGLSARHAAAGSSPTKIIALSTASGTHLTVNSQGDLVLDEVDVAGTDPGALQVDSGGQINATTINVGTTTPPGYSSGSGAIINGTIDLGQTVTDSLSTLPPPSQPAAPNNPPANGSTNYLLPGYYASGYNFNGGQTYCVAPGVYYMDGSWNVGTAAIYPYGDSTNCPGTVSTPDPNTGTGVLLYFHTGHLQINGAISFTSLLPPSQGTYQGILYFQDRGNTDSVVLDGTAGCFVWYEPGGTLTLNGGATLTTPLVVANTVDDINGMVMGSACVMYPGGTATATPSQTSTAVPPSSTPTSTTTPTETSTATATATNSPSPTTTSSPLPNCQLTVLPTPGIIQQGGSETILFTALPSTSITTSILGGTFPITATLYNTSPIGPGAVLTGAAAPSPAPGGYSYVFAAGPDGHARLDFPIPSNAPIGSVIVQTSIDGQGCAGGPMNNTAVFTIFSNRVFETIQRGLIRSVELPPAKGSVLTDRIRVITAPGATISLTMSIVSDGAHGASLGTAADGGTAYTSGEVIFSGTKIAVTGPQGSSGASFAVPLSSALLIPCKGARVLKTVTVTTGSSSQAIKTSFTLREVCLKLLIQPKETTRGNQRPLFVLGRTYAGSKTFSVFSVLVLADPGATITGSATFGTTVLSPVNPAPIKDGLGGRVTLKFDVPNGIAPASGYLTGTVSVTSSFRGGAKTRTASFIYGHR